MSGVALFIPVGPGHTQAAIRRLCRRTGKTVVGRHGIEIALARRTAVGGQRQYAIAPSSWKVGAESQNGRSGSDHPVLRRSRLRKVTFTLTGRWRAISEFIRTRSSNALGETCPSPESRPLRASGMTESTTRSGFSSVAIPLPACRHNSDQFDEERYATAEVCQYAAP